MDTAQTDFNPLPRKEGDGWDAADNAQRLNFNPLPRKEGDFRLIIIHD